MYMIGRMGLYEDIRFEIENIYRSGGFLQEDIYHE